MLIHKRNINLVFVVNLSLLKLDTTRFVLKNKNGKMVGANAQTISC